MEYILSYEKNEDGFFGHFSDLKSVFACGQTLQELKKSASISLGLYFENALMNAKEKKAECAIPYPSEQAGTQGVSIRLCPSKILPILLFNYRVRENKTQKEIAEKAGLKVSNYIRIETGRMSNITIDTLDRLQLATGMNFTF